METTNESDKPEGFTILKKKLGAKCLGTNEDLACAYGISY